jgi:hypothetical protein
MIEIPKTRDTTDWPEGLLALARVIGPESTLKIAEQFGGVEKFYIPRLANRVGLHHRWTKILNDAEWRKVCKVFGGQKISVPRGAFLVLKKRLIIDLAADPNLSHRTIALKVGVTETYVRMVLAGLEFPAHPKQLELF